MVNVPTPQFPDDSRQVARGLKDDGTLDFRQVGFQELDFGAVFGGKTNSNTKNDIGYGVKNWTLDFDEGKILPGHTVQVTSLDDTSGFMYGVVLRKDLTIPSIEVAIHTISDIILTGENWEIQVVEVTRETTVELGNANFTLEDHHKAAFITTDFTTPRVITLPTGTTLTVGARLLIADATADGLSFSARINTPAGVELARLTDMAQSVELMWTGSAWFVYRHSAIAYGKAVSSTPFALQENNNGAANGPNFQLIRVSTSPAANDELGQVDFIGMNSGGLDLRYAKIYGEIVDPASGSSDGAVIIGVLVANIEVDVARFDVNGISSTKGIGYGPGAGGTVTQITSKATAVALNKITGLITTHNAALAANAEVSFDLNNSTIDAADTVIVHRVGGSIGAYLIQVINTAAGSCTISIRNVTAGSLSQAFNIRFTVIKSVSA